MSAVARGLNGERRAAIFLRDLGYLVASRRHIGGAGDLVAWKEDADISAPAGPLLIEVKTNKAGPFATFTIRDRIDLLLTARQYGCEGLLCWWPTPAVGPFWIPAEDWPQLGWTCPSCAATSKLEYARVSAFIACSCGHKERQPLLSNTQPETDKPRSPEEDE